MKKQKVELVLFDTYLAVIKNSVGCQIFRNLYAKVDGKKVDITKNGDLSCAFFASSILYLLKLIKDIHATVDGTVRDMENSGWKKIERPRIGCVIVWKKKAFADGEFHKHIGFYVGDDKAVCSNDTLRQISATKWKFREIESLYWHPKIKTV